MTRLASLLVAVVAVAGLGGCSKPSEHDCRKAIANMQRLMGTDNLREDGRIESEVRRCKGGSKKRAVECAIKAQTLDELRHCEFYKVPANAPGIGTDTGGSGTVMPPARSGLAGSAAGSAAAGSGSAAGSAAGVGSASGSAAPSGSAASPGAAAGSAATSAGSAVGSAK